MATESMINEYDRRMEWLDRFNEELRRRALEPHCAIWPDVKDLYRKGYNPQQAATKYMEWHHLGVNS